MQRSPSLRLNTLLGTDSYFHLSDLGGDGLVERMFTEEAEIGVFGQPVEIAASPSPVPATSIPAKALLTLSVPALNVRAGPGTQYSQIGQLAQGVPSSLAQLAKPAGRDISMAAEQGDPLAKTALARAGTFIGYALANYVHIFNPTIIILGGGVSRSGQLLIEPLRVALAERVLSPEYLQGLVITTVALGDDAGLIGAYVLAQETFVQEHAYADTKRTRAES